MNLINETYFILYVKKQKLNYEFNYIYEYILHI